MKLFLKILRSVLGVVIIVITSSFSVFGQHSYNEKMLSIGENYTLKINSQIKNVFEIEIPHDGNLTLSFQTFAQETIVGLYDKNGHFLQPVSNNIITGNKSYSSWSDNNLHLYWDKTVEKFIGSFTYKLDKGEYHIRISRLSTGLSRMDLSLMLKDLNGNLVYAKKGSSNRDNGGNNNASQNTQSNSVLLKPVITNIWIQEDGVHFDGIYSNGTTDVTAIHTNTVKKESFNDGQVWVDGKGNFAGFIPEDKIQKGVDYNIVVEAKNRANAQTANSDTKTVNMLPKPVITKFETKSDGIHFEGTYSNGTTDIIAIHTNTAKGESFSDGQIWVDGKGIFTGFISEDKIEKGVDYDVVIVAKNSNDGQMASALKTIKIPLPNNSTSLSNNTNNNTLIFDRNNIVYVYIVNESSGASDFGHNFIMFEDKNGNGAVYSYGPHQEGLRPENLVGTPAKMCFGTFTKQSFNKGLKEGCFNLSAKWIQNGKEEKDTGKKQAFDRYVKFSTTNGQKMMNTAVAYLLLHPTYGVVNKTVNKNGKIGQCDNMTSEIAGSGGLGYPVLSWPNWSFNNILSTKKRIIVDSYPK